MAKNAAELLYQALQQLFKSLPSHHKFLGVQKLQKLNVATRWKQKALSSLVQRQLKLAKAAPICFHDFCEMKFSRRMSAAIFISEALLKRVCFKARRDSSRLFKLFWVRAFVVSWSYSIHRCKKFSRPSRMISSVEVIPWVFFSISSHHEFFSIWFSCDAIFYFYIFLLSRSNAT